MDRHLDWEGTFNVRDLGGMEAADGRLTARGALVRADSLSRLTGAGWQALLDHGVRTVVDLRSEYELEEDAAPRPPEVTTVHVPLNGSDGRGSSRSTPPTPEFGTPLFFRAHLMRRPQLAAAVLTAIAEAQPGGVVFHCIAGRDRSGLIAMLALALVGVPAEDIGADYELSSGRLAGLFAAMGIEDEGPRLAAYLAERGTSAAEVIATTLSTLDVQATLKAGGLSDESVLALRERMLEAA